MSINLVDSYLPALVGPGYEPGAFVSGFLGEDSEENRKEFSCKKVKKLACDFWASNCSVRQSGRVLFQGPAWESDEVCVTRNQIGKVNRPGVHPFLKVPVANLHLIGIFDRLESLTLKNQEFPDGSAPYSLRKLSALTFLSINSCGLASAEFLPFLKNLTSLDLRDNALFDLTEGEWPDHKLAFFCCIDNPISPAALERLKNLATKVHSSFAQYQDGVILYERVSTPTNGFLGVPIR